VKVPIPSILGGTAQVVGVVDVERVDAHTGDAGSDQRFRRTLGEVRRIHGIGVGGEVLRMVGAHEYCVPFQPVGSNACQVDSALSPAVDAHRRHRSDAVECEFGHVVAVSEPVERHVEVGARVRADLDHADVKRHARSVRLLGRLARQVRGHPRFGQARIGDEPLADRMAQVDVLL